MTFFQVFWGRKRAMTKSQINQSVIALFSHPSMQGGHFEGGTTEKSSGEIPIQITSTKFQSTK
jgi:hypothetical protein